MPAAKALPTPQRNATRPTSGARGLAAPTPEAFPEPPRIAFQAASSGLSARYFRGATADVFGGADLLPLLSRPVRETSTCTHASGGALWPFPSGAKNRQTYFRLRAGDWFAPVVGGTIRTVHRVLAIDPRANYGRVFQGRSARGRCLVLGVPVDVHADYSSVHGLIGRGSESGPPATVVLEGDVSLAAIGALGIPPVDGPPVAQPTEGGTDGTADEMDRWYRQGLVAQRDALRSALRAAAAGQMQSATESIRRVTGALGVRYATRFPDLARQATSVSRCVDNELMEQAELLTKSIEQRTSDDASIPATVLLVEDEPTAAFLVQQRLAAGNREILHSRTRAEASATLASRDVDLVILDLSLPDADGRDVLVEMRENPRTSAIPAIVLSGAGGAQPQTEGFALGADAYFTKDVDGAVLSAAVSSFLQRAAQIRDQTLRDPLTGLKTRAVFMNSLRDTWNALERQEESLSLAILDIDRFAALNDFQGREAGDAVLRDLGNRLQGLFRRSDLTARWGGDQFAVAFPHTGIEGAHAALAKLQREHAAAQNEHLPGGRRVTFSVGVVDLANAESPDDAVAVAERRLAEAARGAGGAMVHADDIQAPVRSTVVLVEDDALTAQLVGERLAREGLTVVHHTNGMEALNEIPALDVAVLLLDVATPGTDGFGILRRLRRSSTLAHVSVLMLTQDREAQVAKAFELGATDILRKPFALQELVARVRSLIERR